MKILIVADWYSENMGYAENFLPKALGKLNHEVHLVTSNLQVYATLPDYDNLYKEKLGDRKTEIGVFKSEYFTLHRNPSKINRFGIVILGLEKKLKEINPDVTYCFEINSFSTATIVKFKKKYNYHVFCESRIHSSVFIPPKSLFDKAKFWTRNKIFNLNMVAKEVDKFYPIAPDVYSNITKYFGIPPDKCELASLAVETDIFTPVKNAVKVSMFRKKLEFDVEDIVCVYTGRFTQDKGPLVFAKAIEFLHNQGYKNIKGLFVGQGEDDYQNEIECCTGCRIIPFVKPNKLPNIYHSSDIGVWPLQESTSQLDAMACGLPIIVNDKLEDNSRFEGNGLVFKQNDFQDLAEKILFLSDKNKRVAMGKVGSDKILNYYSWDYLAKQKIRDFDFALYSK
jgi:glycosyltransferase involved in cell wall biosynthesis